MTERKWTPGEWVSVNGHCVIVKNSGGGIGYPSVPGTIASLNDGEYIENTNAADAHLIAAAPDLYEALDEMTQFVDRVVKYVDADMFIDKATDALSKARGETQ